MIIRRALPEDVASLAGICVEHAAYEGVTLERQPEAEAMHSALFSEPAALICWVVADDREITGYATATREFSTWQAAYFLHMDCLYLKPEARNRGLGEMLLKKLAGDAIRLQCLGMQWQTPADNLRAARFYRRMGAQSKDKLRFYLSATDTRRLAA